MKRKRLRSFLIGAALGAALGIWTIQIPNTSTHRRNREESSQAAASMSDERPVRDSSRRAASDTWHGEPVVSVARALDASVRAVLPELSELPQDWRLFTPRRLVVASQGGLPVAFEMTGVKEVAGRSVLTGRCVTKPGSMLVTVATADEWTAVMAIPGMQPREFSIRGGHAVVTEIDPEADVCGMELRNPEHPLASTEASPLPPESAAGLMYFSDVVFFYEAKALAEAGSESVIADRMIARIEASNVVLANSRIDNFQWRYAGTFRVPDYTRDEKGDLHVDLRLMNDSSSEVGKFIQMKGTEVGADQMILIVGMPVNYGGLGYMPGNHCVIGWVSSSSYTLTHELGHNLGCHHDRETVEKGTTPNTDTTGDGKHHYGFSYTPQTGTNTFSRGTVMSYSSPIPYFSHPEITYDGVALGVPIGQPRAAHNAQVVSNNASAVAAYRYPAGGPVITAQPSAARIVVGATLSLSVTATGAGLAYQWKKDGVVIDGATASTYTKTSAEIADSGAYSVDVSNVLAWQTSRSASVVVSQPSAPPSSGSSGGGGGGGGAASIWFLMTLGLVVGVRRFLR